MVFDLPEKLIDLIDAYGNELDIVKLSYNLMGMMLDTDRVQDRVSLLGVKELFIYGTDHLGIQLYRTIRDHVKVVAVVDKIGGTSLPVRDVPVINLERFMDLYNGQKVIITPIKCYQEIKRDLSAFIKDKQMLYLGEFLEGPLC